MAILKEQLELIRSPKTTITRLTSNPRAVFVGFKHIFILAVLYELAFLLWALGGATVTMPGFLKIPEDRYYFYELIFAIPVFFVVWIVAGGAAESSDARFCARASFVTNQLVEDSRIADKEKRPTQGEP